MTTTDDADATESRELVHMPPLATELFNPATLTAVLDAIAAKVAEHVPDVTTERGRKEIASLAARVSRSKTAIDAKGKAMVEDWKRQAAAVDKERRRARDTLDALRDACRLPLTRWEEEQEQADRTLIAEILHITAACNDATMNSEQLSERMLHIIKLDTGERFGARQKEAAQAKQDGLTRLTELLTAARDREATELRRAADDARIAIELAELRARVEAMGVTAGEARPLNPVMDQARAKPTPLRPPGLEDALLALVEAIEDLVDNSEGVTGLREAGVLTPWPSLMTGGTWDGWLGTYLENAREALVAHNMGRAR